MHLFIVYYRDLSKISMKWSYSYRHNKKIAPNSDARQTKTSKRPWKLLSFTIIQKCWRKNFLARKIVEQRAFCGIFCSRTISWNSIGSDVDSLNMAIYIDIFYWIFKYSLLISEHAVVACYRYHVCVSPSLPLYLSASPSLFYRSHAQCVR